MPKKRSKAKILDAYRKAVKEAADRFEGAQDQPDELRRAVAEWALVGMYAAVEELMLEIAAASLNRDNEPFEEETGLSLPAHLNLNVCRYLIVGDGYFGFRDLGDLRKKLGRFLGPDHDLLKELKGEKHSAAFEMIAKARNLAAHKSEWARDALKKALARHKVPGADGLRTAGRWLCSIDNSQKWRETFDMPNGRIRLDGIQSYLSTLGDVVDAKAGF